MTPNISIFVGAAPEFDELLDIFRRMLSDQFVFKLRAAATRYKDECQERAIEAADARTAKLSAELLQLEPLLEEYRRATRDQTTGPPSNFRLREVIRKIVELYGPAPLTNFKNL